MREDMKEIDLLLGKARARDDVVRDRTAARPSKARNVQGFVMMTSECVYQPADKGLIRTEKKEGRRRKGDR
jgi:hypothetical protein